MTHDAMEEFYSIIQSSPVRLFEPEEDVDPDWCPWARQLLEFGERLISWVEMYPSPEAIARGLDKLDKRYREALQRAPVEHGARELKATHACLDRALRDLT